MTPTPVLPIAEGLLQSACARMLANANWSVAGALSPASKRKDFPSNGWASVKLRDLASVRDTLSAASGDSPESAGPAPAEIEADARRYRWLRENVNGGLGEAVHDDRGRDLLDGERLDQAIDAALGESHDASA